MFFGGVSYVSSKRKHVFFGRVGEMFREHFFGGIGFLLLKTQERNAHGTSHGDTRAKHVFFFYVREHFALVS
jgi:hypothetical protein